MLPVKLHGIGNPARAAYPRDDAGDERMSEREQESLLGEISGRSAEDAAQLLRALPIERDAANTTTTDSAT